VKFTLQRQEYCPEEGLCGWVLHKKRSFKNRKAAQAAVDSLNRRSSEYESYRIDPEVNDGSR